MITRCSVLQALTCRRVQQAEVAGISAVFFGLVHRAVCLCEELFNTDTTRRKPADADADVRIDAVTLDHERLVDRGDQLFSQGFDLSGLVHAAHENREFIAAQATHHVGPAH